MKITDLGFLIHLQVCFCRICCDKTNQPGLKADIDRMYNEYKLAPRQDSDRYKHALNQYFHRFLMEPGDGQEALRSWYVKWCHYWLMEAWALVQSRNNQPLDSKEEVEVCRHIWRLAMHPLATMVEAKDAIQPFAEIGKPQIKKVVNRALKLMDRPNAGNAPQLLSKFELKKRLANLNNPPYRTKAVVELTNNKHMLLVFQHPNPEHGLVEREFPKGNLFAGVQVGERVILEIKTDSNLCVVEYHARLLTDDEKKDEADELELPEPTQSLYNEKGERDEKAEAAYLATMNEWMDEKLRKRELNKTAGWLKKT